jgi:hypothetical protein
MARFVHPHFQRGANATRQTSYDIATTSHDTWGAASARAVQAEIEKYKAISER